MTNKKAESPDDLFSLLVKLIPFLLGYLFLVGWSYHQAYFGSFGVDQRTLDLGLYDELTKGFAVGLRHGWLWLGLFFLLPLVAGLIHFTRPVFNGVRDLAVILLMLGVTYLGHREAVRYGLSVATVDKSSQTTTLPSLTFKLQGQICWARLLFLKSDTYWVTDLACGNQSVLENQVLVYKATDISDIRILERRGNR